MSCFQWIPCAERMPTDVSRLVIAATEIGHVVCLRWDRNTYAKKPKPRWMRCDGSLWHREPITHWMPLPPAPTTTPRPSRQ